MADGAYVCAMRTRARGTAGRERGLSRRELVARGAALGGAALVAGPLAACGRSEAPRGRRRGRRAGRPDLRVSAPPARRRGAVYEARSGPGRRAVLDRARVRRRPGGGARRGVHRLRPRRMRALVRELGLRLEDRVAWAKRRSAATRGSTSTARCATGTRCYRDYASLKRRLRADARRTGYSRTYASRAARAFDRARPPGDGWTPTSPAAATRCSAGRCASTWPRSSASTPRG